MMGAMAQRKVYNPTDQPVPVTSDPDAPATLGGGEWAMVDIDDPVAAAAHTAGRLVTVADRDTPTPADDNPPDADEAQAIVDSVAAAADLIAAGDVEQTATPATAPARKTTTTKAGR